MKKRKAKEGIKHSSKSLKEIEICTRKNLNGLKRATSASMRKFLAAKNFSRKKRMNSAGRRRKSKNSIVE
jgi:hypothetical protein